MTSFKPTTETYQAGARTLPREYYTSAAVLAAEREKLFATMWNCVGRESSWGAPGSYRLVEVAGESLIVVRGNDGALRAFYNICRHRGTRLCTTDSGTFSRSIRCSYHAWTYATDGRLVAAPNMQQVEDFALADHPLHPAAVALWEGFVFVSLEPDAIPFDQAWAPMVDRLARFNLAELAVGHRVEYQVEANWKLVFQNYNECLHCPTIHPELSTVLPFTSGANDLTEGAILGGSMEIRAPHESATLTGRSCGRALSNEVAADKRAFYYTAMPNMFLSLHPDYVNYYMLNPVAVDRTVVTSEWLFHPDTLASPDSNIGDAIDFWDRTNRQDWDIVGRNQQGVSSRRYQPGPYSARESIPAAWDREYLRLMNLG